MWSSFNQYIEPIMDEALGHHPSWMQLGSDLFRCYQYVVWIREPRLLRTGSAAEILIPDLPEVDYYFVPWATESEPYWWLIRRSELPDVRSRFGCEERIRLDLSRVREYFDVHPAGPARRYWTQEMDTAPEIEGEDGLVLA